MISETEREERKKLVGYCEHCDHYTYFTLDKDPQQCEKCGGKFSNQQGRQITTQRTFSISKSQKKGRKQGA